MAEQIGKRDDLALRERLVDGHVGLRRRKQVIEATRVGHDGLQPRHQRVEKASCRWIRLQSERPS